LIVYFDADPNVTNFGAFVDVGVHQDGLVHISQLADKYIADPAEVVKVGQKVQVTVTEVDLNRNRIALSMRANPELAGQAQSRDEQGGGRSSNGPRRQNNGGGGKQRQNNGGGGGDRNNNSFGGNWFDQAVKKGK